MIEAKPEPSDRAIPPTREAPHPVEIAGGEALRALPRSRMRTERDGAARHPSDRRNAGRGERGFAPASEFLGFAERHEGRSHSSKLTEPARHPSDRRDAGRGERGFAPASEFLGFAERHEGRSHSSKLTEPARP